MKVSTTWMGGLVVVLAAMTGCSSPRGNERTPVACAPVEHAEVAKAAPATPAPVASTPAASSTVASRAKVADARDKRAVTTKPALTVKRIVIATGVAGHEPQGAATLFRQSEIDRLYAYVEVENKSKESAEISVSFEPPDGRAARGNVSLDVGSSPRWRTWAYTKNAHDVGSWTAVVKDADGNTLARQPFEIAL